MNHSIIAGRYAKALFIAGKENNSLDVFKTDMDLLIQTVQDNALFSNLLDNPIIKPEAKIRVMDELLGKKVNAMTLNLINILIKNKREILLSDIARRYISMYEEHKGIKHAQVVSSVELDQKTKDTLQKKLSLMFKADIQMTTKVDPELIGGYIFRVGDVRYDASLLSSLKRMKKVLVNA